LNQGENQQFQLKNALKSDDNAETVIAMLQIQQTSVVGRSPLSGCARNV